MVAHGVGNRHTLKQSLAKYLTMDEYCCDCKAQTYKSIKIAPIYLGIQIT